MTKRYSLTLIFLLLLLISLSLKLYINWQDFLNTPVIPAKTSQRYIFHPGDNVTTLANFLYQQGYLKQPYYFISLARLTGQAKFLKAGEYLFQGGILPRELLNKLQSGDVVSHQFRIIEGWTFQQIINALKVAPMLQHSLKGKSPQEVMKLICDNNTCMQQAEGLFFPSTYQYVMSTRDVEILKKAHALMQQKLNRAWEQRADNLPYHRPYQALIVASMIERESSLAKERPLIAGVIINRLRKNMFLQIDPTVIYGLGEKYRGRLTEADLQTDTPFNTYLNKGLPPTPIGMPSEESILAALHPDNTQALYFVAKGDGSHYFSSSLKAHDDAILKYLSHKSLCQFLGNSLELLCRYFS